MRPDRAVLRHSVRLGGLAPLAAGCLTCTAAVSWLAAGGAAQHSSLFIRISSTAMAALLAGAVGDAIGELSDACPIGRLRQRALRVLAALAVLLVGWSCFVAAVTTAAPDNRATPPWGGLSVELSAYAAVAIAAAAWRVRQHPADGLPAGAVAVAAVGLISALPLPRAWGLLSAPGSPDWAAVHWRWAALAVGAALLAIWWSRDPARPGLRARHPGRAVSRTAAATAGATAGSNTLGTM